MKKLLPLTGIRAIAAFWVILFHLLPMFDYGFFNPLANKGYLGVDLFFILSGFIISYVHQHEFKILGFLTTFRFLVLRCARILPVHYFMLLVFVAFFVLKGFLSHAPISFETAGTRRDFILHLLNVQGWGFADHNSWNTAAWSISAEWFAYLTFPLTAPFVQRLKSIRANIVFILACFGFMTVFSLTFGLSNLGWTFHNALIRVCAEFFIGCSLYNIYKQNADRHTEWLITLPLTLLLAGFWLNIPDIALVLLITPILYGLSKSTGWLARFLSTRPMTYLGDISFSIYMVHSFLYERLHPLDQKIHFVTPGASLHNVVIFTGIVLGIIAAAHLLYRYVEVPARNVIRALLDTAAPKPRPVPTLSNATATH